MNIKLTQIYVALISTLTFSANVHAVCDDGQTLRPNRSQFVDAKSISQLDANTVLIRSPYYKVDNKHYPFLNTREIGQGVCKLFGYGNATYRYYSYRNTMIVTINEDGSFGEFLDPYSVTYGYNSIDSIQCNLVSAN